MSGTLNKVMLIGNLGDEVKVHYFENGNCIGRFPLATNETYTNKQTGERITNTEWHNIVVKNKVAEICEKYLAKGDKVYIEGKLKTRQWQGEDNVNRYTTEVHLQDFTFLTTKKDRMPQAAQGNKSEQSQKSEIYPKTNSENPGSDLSDRNSEEKKDQPF